MFKINYQQPVKLQKNLDFLKYMGRVLDQEVGLKDCYIGILYTLYTLVYIGMHFKPLMKKLIIHNSSLARMFIYSGRLALQVKYCLNKFSENENFQNFFSGKKTVLGKDKRI